MSVYNKAVEYYKQAGEKNAHALTRLGVLYDTAQKKQALSC